MTFLDKFSRHEQEMLISLPYRAGVWITYADGAQQHVATERETAALNEIIIEKGRSIFESAFVYEVMAEICRRREDWKYWSLNVEAVPADCATACKIITAKLGPHDLNVYRETVMDIATTVAHAFREFDSDAPLSLRISTYTKLIAHGLIALFRTGKIESSEFLNISYDEHVALTRLSDSLGLQPTADGKNPDATD
jgi:hypothetical protein